MAAQGNQEAIKRRKKNYSENTAILDHIWADSAISLIPFASSYTSKETQMSQKFFTHFCKISDI